MSTGAPDGNESIDFAVNESTVVDEYISGSPTQRCTCLPHSQLFGSNQLSENRCKDFWAHIGCRSEPPGTLLKWAAQLELESGSLYDMVATLTKSVTKNLDAVGKCDQTMRKLALLVETEFQRITRLVEETRRIVELKLSPSTANESQKLADCVAHRLLEDQVFGDDEKSIKFDRLERGIVYQSRGINDIKRQLDLIHRRLTQLESNDTATDEEELFVEPSPVNRRRTIASTELQQEHLSKLSRSRKMSLY
jgi:hypothetical protein